MRSLATSDLVAAQLELADVLRAGRDRMQQPQDLPGRYGRVIAALDRVLRAVGCQAVVAGGWAVWRHGYVGRVTQDVDIVVPAAQLDDLLRAAAVAGFEVLPAREGLWPKLRHKESDVTVDLLPEGATPGTPAQPAPTTIPHPSQLGARGSLLAYADLAGLIQLKLAAGRVRDDADVVELIRANADQLGRVREYLATVHANYLTRFNQLADRAQEQTDH